MTPARRSWIAPALACALLAVAGAAPADVADRDPDPVFEGGQAQQRLDLNLRQAQRTPPPGLTSRPEHLRFQERKAVEQMRLQALQAEQRFDRALQRGGGATDGRYEEQVRQQVLRSR